MLFSAVFQQLEVDYCLQQPRQDIWPTNAAEVPVVRMFGVNDAGAVLAQVTMCTHIAAVGRGQDHAAAWHC